MATCPHAERITPLLHDGELQNPLRREMITHLSSCVTCARIFSFLDREQELLSQAIEVQVDSVDFSNFWQGVAEKLSEPQLSWGIRLRLWYETSRFMWSSPLPAWAVAVLLLLFVPAHVPPSRNTLLTPPAAPKKVSQTGPREALSRNATSQSVQSVSTRQHEAKQSEWQPMQRLPYDNQVQIDSLDPSVTVAIRIDRTNNSTVVWVGEGTSAE